MAPRKMQAPNVVVERAKTVLERESKPNKKPHAATATKKIAPSAKEKFVAALKKLHPMD